MQYKQQIMSLHDIVILLKIVAPPLKEEIHSNENFVWPYGKGTVRGHSIMPLYPTVPQAGSSILSPNCGLIISAINCVTACGV